MDSHEEVFCKWHLFSKEDILKSLELIEYVKNGAGWLLRADTKKPN